MAAKNISKEFGLHKAGNVMSRLTKRFIDSIQEPGIYKDGELTGFYLQVSKKSKTYKVKAKLKGTRKDIRITIGRHGDPWTPTTAREEAEKLLRDLRTGTNPNEERRSRHEKAAQAQALAETEKELTVRRVFADYVESRNIKVSTAKVYKYVVYSRFEDWLDRPMISITRKDIKSRHAQISKKHPGDANHAMRILRALFEFAIAGDEHGVIKENPVKYLSMAKEWNRLKRRQNVIKQFELESWCKAVDKLSNEVVQDYLLFLLFTGLRKNEAMKLKWKSRSLAATDSYVDLQDKSFTVLDTKNGVTHTLPLTDFLEALVKRRYKDNPKSPYVFPGLDPNRHLVDVRYHQAKVEEVSGIPFSLHDLRRTFITIAKRLGIDEDFVKGLANHKTGDVTFGYTVMDDEDRRNTMQKITNYIVKEAGLGLL